MKLARRPWGLVLGCLISSLPQARADNIGSCERRTLGGSELSLPKLDDYERQAFLQKVRQRAVEVLKLTAEAELQLPASSEPYILRIDKDTLLATTASVKNKAGTADPCLLVAFESGVSAQLALTCLPTIFYLLPPSLWVIGPGERAAVIHYIVDDSIGNRSGACEEKFLLLRPRNGVLQTLAELPAALVEKYPAENPLGYVIDHWDYLPGVNTHNGLHDLVELRRHQRDELVSYIKQRTLRFDGKVYRAAPDR